MLRYGSKNFETWNCFLAVLACILHELHVLSVSKDYEPYEANKQHGCIFSSMVRLSPFSAFTQLASYHSICSRSPIHSVPSKWHRVFSWHVLVASGKEATWFSGILFVDEFVLSALKSFSSTAPSDFCSLWIPPSKGLCQASRHSGRLWASGVDQRIRSLWGSSWLKPISSGGNTFKTIDR